MAKMPVCKIKKLFEGSRVRKGIIESTPLNEAALTVGLLTDQLGEAMDNLPHDTPIPQEALVAVEALGLLGDTVKAAQKRFGKMAALRIQQGGTVAPGQIAMTITSTPKCSPAWKMEAIQSQTLLENSLRWLRTEAPLMLTRLLRAVLPLRKPREFDGGWDANKWVKAVQKAAPVSTTRKMKLTRSAGSQ